MWWALVKSHLNEAILMSTCNMFRKTNKKMYPSVIPFTLSGNKNMIKTSQKGSLTNWPVKNEVLIPLAFEWFCRLPRFNLPAPSISVKQRCCSKLWKLLSDLSHRTNSTCSSAKEVHRPCFAGTDFLGSNIWMIPDSRPFSAWFNDNILGSCCCFGLYLEHLLLIWVTSTKDIETSIVFQLCKKCCIKFLSNTMNIYLGGTWNLYNFYNVLSKSRMMTALLVISSQPSTGLQLYC